MFPINFTINWLYHFGMYNTPFMITFVFQASLSSDPLSLSFLSPSHPLFADPSDTTQLVFEASLLSDTLSLSFLPPPTLSLEFWVTYEWPRLLSPLLLNPICLLPYPFSLLCTPIVVWKHRFSQNGQTWESPRIQMLVRSRKGGLYRGTSAIASYWGLSACFISTWHWGNSREGETCFCMSVQVTTTWFLQCPIVKLCLVKGNIWFLGATEEQLEECLICKADHPFAEKRERSQYTSIFEADHPFAKKTVTVPGNERGDN